MIRSLCLTLLLTLFALPAMAQPGMKSAGFKKMDANSDGVVSWEEYHKVIPNMKRAAFDAMDSNKDGKLTRDERGSFMNLHSKDANAPKMGGGMGMPPKGMMGMPPKGKPMLMPPSENKKSGADKEQNYTPDSKKTLLVPPPAE